MEKSKAKVYIDGANMFYTQKSLGWFIDFKKLRNFLEKKWDVTGIKYYTGVRENDDKMASFLKYLDHLEIEPVTKPLKRIKNSGILKKLRFEISFSSICPSNPLFRSYELQTGVRWVYTYL